MCSQCDEDSTWTQSGVKHSRHEVDDLWLKAGKSAVSEASFKKHTFLYIIITNSRHC